MSMKSGATSGTNPKTTTTIGTSTIFDKIINDASPKSFSSNELDELFSLSDTSFDTNGNLVKRMMPIWPQSTSNAENNTNNDEDENKSPTNDKNNTSNGDEMDKIEKEKAAVAAAAAAADALGKDLEAMGYDLECRSFIKKHGEDSFPTAPTNEKNETVERYTSTNTVAPFSEEEEQNNNQDVLKLLRSTSDLIEATRSSSDMIIALRSLSSEDQIQQHDDDHHSHKNNTIEPNPSVVSSGTGPMMTVPPKDDESVSLNNNNKQPPNDTNSLSSRKSHRSSSNMMQSQPSNKSVCSQKSMKSLKSHRSNNKVEDHVNNNTATTASIVSQRSQKTNSSTTRRNNNIRNSTNKIHIEHLPRDQLDQTRKVAAPVIVETVMTIPSTLSQYNVQYTTTEDDDDEPLMLLASPSKMAAIKTTTTDRSKGIVVPDETVVVSNSLTTEQREPPIEVSNTGIKMNWTRSKTKGTSKNLETGSYHHVVSTIPSPSPNDASGTGSKSSSERLPKLLRSTSEGGKPSNNTRHLKFHKSPQRSIRNNTVTQKKDGTVKSKNSYNYWSAKNGSRKSRNTTKSKSPNCDADDDVSEVSSVASSFRAAPPFPILSIPMKGNKKSFTTTTATSIAAAVTTESTNQPEQRPPRIPTGTSSQRSVVSSKSKTDVISQQGYIETKRSVDSRTMEEMSPEGMEMTTIEKLDDDIDGSNQKDTSKLIDVGITTTPSVETKSSAKKILQAFSVGSKAGSKTSSSKRNKSRSVECPVNVTTSIEVEKSVGDELESPGKEDMLGITSNLSVEDDNEEKAKEQEQIARQLILANTVERQRRIRRSLHARDTLLKLVQQKESEDKLESMTLPPTFERSNPTMRSTAMTAPAHVEYNTAPPIVPATTTSMTTMPREAPLPTKRSKELTSKNSDVCNGSIASDATPKVRGGARIFNFLSFSPEKRQRAVKVSKHPLTTSSATSTLLPNVRPTNEKRPSKTKKKSVNHRSLFSFKKKDGSKSRSSLFSMKKKDANIKPTAIVTSPKPQDISIKEDIELPTNITPVLTKNPKVTYVDLDESFEAIEVAFSKSPTESFSSHLPKMLGTDTVLEKIVEEGSFEDVRSNASSPDVAPLYDVQPLMISPINVQSNLMNDDMLDFTRKAAIEDLKKVGATMIASTNEIPTRNEGEIVIKECEETPTKPMSFFSVVDKWFFEPLTSKPSATTTSKELTVVETTTRVPTDWVREGKELTGKVLSGLALTSKEANTTRDVEMKTGGIDIPVVMSMTSKHREKTLEYLDQELKSREENSLKSIAELEEKIMNGTVLYERTVPTHLILNNANDDDGSCLTALDSTLTRTLPQKAKKGFSEGKDDVSALSDVLTMDQWNEIAEAAYTVERALKNIELSGGLKSTKSDANTSKPSFAFINDEVEDALHILSKHAARLGVSESDILMALGGSFDEETIDETMDQSMIAAQQKISGQKTGRNTENDDADAATMGDNTINTPTMGEEILDVLQMYMVRK